MNNPTICPSCNSTVGATQVYAETGAKWVASCDKDGPLKDNCRLHEYISGSTSERAIEKWMAYARDTMMSEEKNAGKLVAFGWLFKKNNEIFFADEPVLWEKKPEFLISSRDGQKCVRVRIEEIEE